MINPIVLLLGNSKSPPLGNLGGAYFPDLVRNTKNTQILTASDWEGAGDGGKWPTFAVA